MNEGRARAQEILRELRIDSPEMLAHLKEICCERGAFVKEGELENSEARLVVHGKKGIITVKPNLSYATRMRFSIAHELGHFELHRGLSSLMSCDQNAINDWGGKRGSRDLETEANEFASELLLPEQLVSNFIGSEKPSLALMEKIAAYFGTSLFATLRRFMDLTPEACAAIFHRDGFVAYMWQSKNFQSHGYRIKGQVQRYTYAHDVFEGKSVPKEMSEVEAINWLKIPHWHREEMLKEEATYFPKLRLGLSLLWMEEGALLKRSKTLIQ